MDDRPTRRNKAAFSKFRPISKVNGLFFSSDPLAVKEKKSLSVSQDTSKLITVKILTREP